MRYAGRRCAEHEVLLAEERPDVQPACEEEADEQAHGQERDDGAHQLRLHGGADGVVHGAQHPAPPGQEGPDGGQRRQPQGHFRHEQPAGRLPEPHEGARAQRHGEHEQACAHVEGDQPPLRLPAGQGVVETGARAHVEEARQLGEEVGGKAVAAVHLRAEGAREDGFHGKVDGHRGDVGQELEEVALREGGGGCRHAGEACSAFESSLQFSRFGMLAVASADAETRTGAAQGFGSEVKVTVTVEDGKITALDVDDSGETYTLGGFDRAETVEKLKADADKYKAELEEAKKIVADGEKYKNDYETLKAEYDGYKTDVETKAAKAESDRTFTKWLRDNGYTEKGAAKIVKYGGFTPEFNKDGTIKNADKLSESVNAEWSEYKASEKTEGARTETPPTNTGGNTITREDILKIPNTAERQKAIAENGALFGIK